MTGPRTSPKLCLVNLLTRDLRRVDFPTWQEGKKEEEEVSSSFCSFLLKEPASPARTPNDTTEKKTHSWRSYESDNNGWGFFLGSSVDERNVKSGLILLSSTSTLKVGISTRGGSEGLEKSRHKPVAARQYSWSFSRDVKSWSRRTGRGGKEGKLKLTFSLKPCFLGPLSLASFFLSADLPDWGAR